MSPNDPRSIVQDPERLLLAIAEMKERLVRTADPPADEVGGTTPDLEFAFTSLAATLEELEVAEEELRSRNLQLAEAASALEGERRRFAELFEHAPIAYFVTDGAGVIQEINRSGMELLGEVRRSVVGRPLPLYLAPRDRDRVFDILRDDWSGAEVRAVDVVLSQLNSGTQVPCNLRLAPVSPGSSSTGFRWIARDLRAERRISELSRLSERKDAFISVAGHEIRNPLAAMQVGLDLLVDQLPDVNAVAHPIRVLRRQIQQMARLVDDLLESSHARLDSLQVKRGPVRLADVIDETISSVQARVEARDQLLIVDIPAEEVVVHGDRGRLVQIVVNLVDNAAKYTPDGGQLGLTANIDEFDCILRVWDEGRGIPPEQVEYLSEMFVQGAPPSVGVPTGLGIGLGLARQLIEQQEGHIQIFSPGEGRTAGTEIVLRIPLHDCPQRLAQANKDPMTDETTNSAWTMAQRRILVVDDNEDLVQMMSELLRRDHHDVRVATEGLEAVEIAKEFEPHIVLLDLRLPGMAGEEVARRLRDALGRVPKIIAISGYSSDEVKVGRDFDMHLLKPVDIRRLRDLIDAGPVRPKLLS